MMDVIPEIIVFAVAVFAGGVASVAGFGIGSIITPVLSLFIGAKLAIVVVSIPHLIGNLIRLLMLHAHLDRRVLFSFGLMSAAGSFIGALLHAKLATPALALVLGGLLIFAGLCGVTGISKKWRFHGIWAWIAGGISGGFGGLVGNQGGIRAAAMLGLHLPKESFVATATAIALIVDLARIPVYFWSHTDALLESGRWVALTTLGVVIGTLVGARVLKNLPARGFRIVVSILILLLGLLLCLT
jgi:uncharacterized membrane protein YfcA